MKIKHNVFASCLLTVVSLGSVANIHAVGFTNTGTMTTERIFHTATLLPNGKVLVTGGIGNGPTVASAEVYDPATGIWTTAGSMATNRYNHTATLLSNGKVLVTGGGKTVGAGNVYYSSAELYDPANGTWTPTGTMTTNRQGHTATLLPNGKVLVTGGYNGVVYLASAELYDPATGIWTATGTMTTNRQLHTATLLPNGKVLVIGGYNGVFQASVEVYDPATGTWTGGGSLGIARYAHTAILLTNGKVLITDGYGDGGVLASVVLYDPATTNSATTGNLSTARYYHTVTLLSNGKVFLTGGLGNSGVSAFAEVYDPATGIWTPSGFMNSFRYGHTATSLPNGKVLYSGGGDGSVIVASAELYDTGLATPPQITSQPSSQTVVVTSNATFSVTASGTTPLAYQWRSNNAVFSGGTNNSLTVSNASFANAGNYQVIVTNSYGGVTSSVVSLTLVAHNQITPQLLAGGKVYLGYGGAPGTNYALDRTFNLRSPVSWIPQVTNSAGTGGVLILTNTPDPGTNNFWRIRSVP